MSIFLKVVTTVIHNLFAPSDLKQLGMENTLNRVNLYTTIPSNGAQKELDPIWQEKEAFEVIFGIINI
jgi:hypothetical protein